nr:MGMT family protein [Janibacter alkaliphilus]
MVERVLRAVELVPAGRVVSYGDLAALVGTGPRQVGSVMRHYGSNVAWWRVTNAAGEHVPHLREAAFARWADEGILLTHGGRGCRIADHRVDLVALERAWRERVADLPE